MVCGNYPLSSGLLFSHPMPLRIGYWFHSFVDAFYHRVLSIGYLVPWFLSYLMPLGIRELAHGWGRAWALRVTEDHGISRWF